MEDSCPCRTPPCRSGLEGGTGLAALGRQLNSLLVKSVPPTRARIAPVFRIHAVQRACTRPLAYLFRASISERPLITASRTAVCAEKIQRRVNGQPSLYRDVRAVFFLHVAADVLHKVRGDLVFRLHGPPGSGGGCSLRHLVFADEAFFLHARQDVDLPLFCPVEIEKRGVGGGAFGKPARSAASGSVRSRALFAEVADRRRFDPIGAVSQINLIQVQMENLILGQVFVDAVGTGSLPSAFGHIFAPASGTSTATCWVMVLPPCTILPASTF